MSELGDYVVSPVVQSLLDHLKIETQIAQAKDNLYSFVWAISPITIFEDIPNYDSQQIISWLNEKANELAKNSELTSENLLALALSVKILHRAGTRISKQVTNELDAMLVQANEHRIWQKLPEATGLMAFALADMPKYHEYLLSLGETLSNIEREAYERRLYPRLIDAQFGMAFIYPERLDSRVFEQILESLEVHSLEKIAKLCITLHKAEQYDHLRSAVLTLEEKVKSGFKQWILPNLELSLFEGINLVNSNLPTPIVKEILGNLRVKSNSWANNLEIEENAVVITNIDSITRVPSFNPVENALSLIALRYGNLWYYYLLNSEEHKVAIQGANALKGKKDFQIVQSYWLKRLMWLSLLLPFVPIALIWAFPNAFDTLGTALGLIWDGKFDEILQTFTQQQWRDLIALFLWIAYASFVLWFFSALNTLRNSGKIDKWWRLAWPYRMAKKKADEYIFDKEE